MTYQAFLAILLLTIFAVPASYILVVSFLRSWKGN